IVSSATPMINSEEELRLVLNLILPYLFPDNLDWKNLTNAERIAWFRGQQPRSLEEATRYFNGQIPREFRFRTAKKEILEVYLRGKIVYVRALDNGVDVEYVGEAIGVEQ